ncbi:phage tail tube protein [Nesterenkonia sp. PF2B19]|uniref:phage tail tube protein n=2 Tax=Bacteria TaxID=2 RepID=UPI0008722C29|nr:phage tail tube protein [Nesterenkonia sp. PF2B19]OSM43460.1 outer capsid protein Hoc [Nesterenkonia sp. PF2B19]
MAGIDAFGTTLSREDDAGSFEPIANVTSLSPPNISRETLDVTSHDSPNGYMEFLGGLKDPGEVSVEVNYDPSQHDKLVDDFEEDDPIKYEIAFPDGTVWAFEAILTAFEPDAPYDDKLTAEMTLKVTSKPEITEAA